MVRSRFFLTWVCFFALLQAGCLSWQKTKINSQLTSSQCNQQNIYTYTEQNVPAPLYQLTLDTMLSNKISHNSLNMANAIGILDLLTKYIQLKGNSMQASDLIKRIHALEVKQEIDNRISMSSLVISAVSSELDCEEERTSQVANFLKGKESDLESKLTMGAIVIGASGAIATGGTIKNEGLSNGIGIGTGIAEASLGLMMLFNNRKTDFFHERNALKDIWEGPTVSPHFPAFVWYYLNTRPNGNGQNKTIREQIIEKWKSFGQIEDDELDLKLIHLYFGRGGRYSTDQLNNRADMYDQVESQVNLMKQELMALSLEIQKI